MTIDDNFNFSEWLMDEMEEQGLKVIDLAKMSGMTPAGLRNLLYEYRCPRFDTFRRIMGALGKKIEITDRTDIPMECPYWDEDTLICEGLTKWNVVCGNGKHNWQNCRLYKEASGQK